jgi:hypothetical protein
LSTPATAGLSVIIKFSVAHLVPYIKADRLIATKPFLVCVPLSRKLDAVSSGNRLRLNDKPVRLSTSPSVSSLHGSGSLKRPAESKLRDHEHLRGFERRLFIAVTSDIPK